MGNGLPGACCTTASDIDGQVVDGVGRENDINAAIFVSDNFITCDLPRLATVTQHGLPTRDGSASSYACGSQDISYLTERRITPRGPNGDRAGPCPEPRACAESEWNSQELLIVLNTRAKALRLEFAPVPVASPGTPVFTTLMSATPRSAAPVTPRPVALG